MASVHFPTVLAVLKGFTWLVWCGAAFFAGIAALMFVRLEEDPDRRSLYTKSGVQHVIGLALCAAWLLVYYFRLRG